MSLGDWVIEHHNNRSYLIHVCSGTLGSYGSSDYSDYDCYLNSNDRWSCASCHIVAPKEIQWVALLSKCADWYEGEPE